MGIEARGVFSEPWRARHVLCSDGRRRTAYVTGAADTYFSLPARVTVKGKTVAGFITPTETATGERDLHFIAYDYRTNGHLLPGLPVEVAS